MKKNTILYITLTGLVLSTASCKKDFGNLNSPTVQAFTNNASSAELNTLVSGSESGMRNAIVYYLDDVSIIGREYYRFSGSEPRFTSDLLGGGTSTLGGNNFYIANPWTYFYQVIKNCNVLIQAANNSKLISTPQRNGYLGFARTIKAYELLLALNLTDTNGIRINVEDPDHLGPIVKKTAALAAIAALLDSAKTDFSNATISYTLAGFDQLGTDAAGLIKVNRALAARVAVYRQDWPGAQAALAASFYAPDGDYNTGVYHGFGTGSGDQLDGMYFPPNQNGEVRVAHPSYAADIENGDDRISKTLLRTTPASQKGLSGDRDLWVYTSSTARVPIIRNEELVLIAVEVDIRLAQPVAAKDLLNKIRFKHGLPPYIGTLDLPNLNLEMIKQRRYSLFGEGHRWIDLRRLNLLATLPIDRAGDDVWSAFPLPVTEQ